MSAMFVETITAPINNTTMKSLNDIDLENVNNYFEIVDGKKPMHPYIDIDGKINSSDEQDFYNLNQQILDKLITIEDASILSSSKYACVEKKEIINKFSYRLTFYNEVCKDKNECKEYIRNVKYPYLQDLLQDIIDINDKANTDGLNVDFSVYRTKGKIRCVNAYKSKNDKTRINHLIKGTIDQTIICANNMNSIEIETKTEPVILGKNHLLEKGEPKNDIEHENIVVESAPKPIAVTNKKINTLQEQLLKLQEQLNKEMEKEQKKQKTDDDDEIIMDNLSDFYHSYFLNDLLNIIDIHQLDHTDWIKIVLSFKKCDGVFEDLVEWNKQHKSFNINGLQSVWDQYTIDENEMSIATLKHYAELTNKKRYIVWVTIVYKSIELQNSMTETNLAKLYLAFNTDNIVSYNNKYYLFQRGEWHTCNNNDFDSMRYSCRETLYKYFKNISKNLKMVLNDYNEKLTECKDNKDKYDLLFDKMEQFRKHKNKIEEVKLIVNKTQWINNIMKEVRTTLNNNQTTEDLFDKQHHLFAFTNAIFDLETGKRVKFDKKLYLTTNSGKKYIEPTQEQLETIHNIFVSIFPDPEIRSCYMSILRTALSGYRLEKVVVANGNGRNGKGLINELFGFLCVGANPQLANLDNKRFVVCCEPEDGRSIRMNTAKEITGCDTLNARGLYQSETVTNLLLTLVIEVNKRPELSGRMDNAILNRLIDVNFVNTFTDNPDLINNIDSFKANVKYKHYDFKKQHYCALFKYILMNAPKDLYIPKSVRTRSKEYVVDNEEFFGWMSEHYIITNNQNDIVKVKDLFSNYKNSEFYMHLTKKQKRKCNLKSFQDTIKHHLILKNHYRTHRTKKTAAVRLVGIKEKCEDHDSDSDSE
jgi:phage/plasmid-associated DNA primase